MRPTSSWKRNCSERALRPGSLVSLSVIFRQEAVRHGRPAGLSAAFFCPCDPLSGCRHRTRVLCSRQVRGIGTPPLASALRQGISRAPVSASWPQHVPLPDSPWHTLEDTCCVLESRAHALSQISRALSCRPCMGSGEDRCCEHRTGTDVCRRHGPAGRSLPAPGKQRTGLLPLSALLPADVRLERTLSGKAEAAGDEKKPPFPGADTVCEQKSYALGMGSQVVPEKAHRA